VVTANADVDTAKTSAKASVLLIVSLRFVIFLPPVCVSRAAAMRPLFAPLSRGNVRRSCRNSNLDCAYFSTKPKYAFS
jgi:hypothetical protein